MNLKSGAAGETRATLNLSGQQLRRWFKAMGGEEKAPTAKPIVTDELKTTRLAWSNEHWDVLTDPTKPVAFLDEKWFYTTNRRRKIKHLPRAPWEEEGIDKISRPRVVSRRHPIKVMYMGIVARPRELLGFDGRVHLERVCITKQVTTATAHTRFTDDVILNSELRENSWRHTIVPDGEAVNCEDLKELVVGEYGLDDYIAERLEFSYRTYAGNQGQEKIVRYGDTDLVPSGTRRLNPDSHDVIPVTINDVVLQVRQIVGDEVEEDVSCDSAFMLGAMDRVGQSLRRAFYWVRQNEWIYLVMDNAGGHGTNEAWETFTQNLETKYKVKIIRQCPRSPETNLLDLGIWASIQAAVEKRMFLRWGDTEALANAVKGQGCMGFSPIGGILHSRV
jgi:hypothetical protein